MRSIIGSFDIFDDINMFEHKIGENVPIKPYKVIVEVYGDEGKDLPHFHVYTPDHTIDAPIRLYSCGYFLHGKHASPLPYKGAKELDSWLRKRSTKNPDKTNWEYADSVWVDLYGESKRFTNTQPDYSKLDASLENKSIHVDIDLKITNKNLFKINNNSIKLGFEKDDATPSIVIMGSVNDNSKSIPCVLKYIWYHKDTGDKINVSTHINNKIKYNEKDIERLVKNVVGAELFKINNDASNYVPLDLLKISNKVGRR